MDEEGSAKTGELTEERSAQYAVTVPFGALYGSATSFVNQEGFSFHLDHAGATLFLPRMVTCTLGVTPVRSTAAVRTDGRDHFRVLFEANDTAGRSYWLTVFGTDQPNLVMEFATRVDGADVDIWPYDEWLVWPWHKNSDDRIASLKTARDRQAKFEEDAQISELTRRAAMDGPRSALFEGVAKHFGWLP